MTLVVRDEVDIVAATIEHHLAAGVDRIIVADHRSVDGTSDVLAAYANAGALELHQEDGPAFRQAAWTTAMARQAAIRLGASWVINGDADEFLWPPVGVVELLKSTRVSCLVVERDNLAEDPTTDSSWPWPSRLVLRDTRSLRNEGKRIAPKMIHVADPEVSVGAGGHIVSGPLIGPPYADHPLRILHAPDRGFTQYRQKISNGAAAVEAADLDARICRHWRDEAEQLKDGTFADAYLAGRLTAAEVDRRLVSGRLVRDTRLRDHLAKLVSTAVLPAQLAKVVGGLRSL
ncbi:glycosyltransferase family 2 protein [Catelliglobosispora koreensis]|uniref:glycosyltransferase family 2 protein n=1 Tax=Catelliglobosispora koreensis TaxID=129052 RepID=UPI0012F9792B|nr:glycosyltransferase family 2 protein [Catelliglobosispora koreensis]